MRRCCAAHAHPGDGGGGGSGAAGTLTAKIGSDTFNALQIEAELSGSAFGPDLNISGIMANGKIINIQLINPAVGSFLANTNFENLLLFAKTVSAILT